MKKFWYEEGMCRALGYKGQYPVTYTSEDKITYKRSCMSCSAIADGHCTQHETCEVFWAAPESMENNWQLRDKKMG